MHGNSNINSTVLTELEHLYKIYSNPTHDKHQWLLLQFIVMMDAKGVRNMYSIPVVDNKHNTAKVASCWFIIYYFLKSSGCIEVRIFSKRLADRFFVSDIQHPRET